MHGSRKAVQYVYIWRFNGHSFFLFPPYSTPSGLWLCGYWRRSWEINRPASRTMLNSPSWRPWRHTKTPTRRYNSFYSLHYYSIAFYRHLKKQWCPPHASVLGPVLYTPYTKALWVISSLSVQVVRAAEEAASTLAGSIHPEQCIKVLCPIVQTADYPINLAAIKMQTKVIERITKESLHQLLPDIIPGLLQVRIWSCFCIMWVFGKSMVLCWLRQPTGHKLVTSKMFPRHFIFVFICDDVESNIGFAKNSQFTGISGFFVFLSHNL